MRRILSISGSASQNSSNTRLLVAIQSQFDQDFGMEVYDGLWKLPLFSPQLKEEGIPESVADFKQRVALADAAVISTPEYLHNIPAVLKNALEWMTESGELADKPVLAITFTPAAPRGEHAMRSLVQSLVASKAKVVAELPLFRNEWILEDASFGMNEEHRMLLTEALGLL